MATLKELEAQVKQNRSVTDSAVTAFEAIADRIENIQEKAAEATKAPEERDVLQDELDLLVAELRDQGEDLARALASNTPGHTPTGEPKPGAEGGPASAEVPVEPTQDPNSNASGAVAQEGAEQERQKRVEEQETALKEAEAEDKPATGDVPPNVLAAGQENSERPDPRLNPGV